MEKKIKIKYVVSKRLPGKPAQPLFSKEQVQKFKTVGGVVLGVMAVLGTVSLAIVAPNAVQLLGYLPGVKKNKHKFTAEQEIVKAVYYLKSRGYIKIVRSEQDFAIKITQKGRKKVLKLDFNRIEVPRPAQWDKKWWLTIADVPVEERQQANSIRLKFRDLGFYPLQRTVWAYPFDPRDQVDFVSSYYRLDKYLTVMRVDVLDESDRMELEQFFKKEKVI